MSVSEKWRWPVLAAVLVAGACAHATKEKSDARNGDAAVIYLRVENNHWLDVNVYAITSGDFRIRLGTVMAFKTAHFRLPDGFGSMTDMRLMADAIGEQNVVVTESILTLPGDEIMWRLAEPLRTSSYTLRRINR